MSWRLRLVLLGVLAAVGLGGIRSSRSLPPAADRTGLGALPPGVTRSDLNVLLITLDTTRADRLGAYGFQSISTPHIDRLAREGVLFQQTAAAAPLTLPAHASLFTGRIPPAHGVRDNAGFVLDSRETTLAELFKQRGYRTGAFVGSYVLAAGRGLSQGFDTYRDDFSPPDERSTPGGVQRRGNEVVDRALSWLAQVGSSRFFAWVHFYDPHLPYDPPEPYRTLYAGRPYDGEIAFVDAQIGRVLGFLQQGDLLDRTIVVIIGDHGESLGDHGETAHAVFVYESVIRVPFIIRAPFERLSGRIVDDLTRSIDMMPTLLDVLGISSPPAADGTSLLPLMTGAVRRLDLEAYAESLYPLHRFGWSDLRALRAGRFKVIAAPRPELYDLQKDPFEEHNEYDTRQTLGERMIARLQEIEQRANASMPPARSPVSVDAETAARLAALGYVDRSGGSQSIGDADVLPDPKDQIGLLGPGGRP